MKAIYQSTTGPRISGEPEIRMQLHFVDGGDIAREATPAEGVVGWHSYTGDTGRPFWGHMFVDDVDATLECSLPFVVYVLQERQKPAGVAFWSAAEARAAQKRLNAALQCNFDLWALIAAIPETPDQRFYTHRKLIERALNKESAKEER